MSYPIDFSAFAPILKKILREQGLTYRDLAKRLHMSEANIKKIMVAQDCSLKRLNQICEALDLSFFDLIEMLRQQPVRQVALSKEQQNLLMQDETNLHLYFKVAFEGVSTDKAKKELRLTDAAFTKKLRSLESAGLLKRNASGRLAPPEEHVGVWSDGGPLSKFIKQEWTTSVLKSAISGSPSTGQELGLRYFRLSEKSAQELRSRMKELLNDFERASAIEAKIHPNSKHVSCLYAILPSSLTEIRRSGGQ